MKGVKAIIFDLGNVIIELHYEKTIKMLQEFSGMDAQTISEQLVTAPLLQQFEMGKIDEDQFRVSFCGHMNLPMSASQFDEIWNSFLGEVSKERVARLLALRNHYQTFILSNTNSIHERHFNQALHHAHGYKQIDNLVDRTYLSHLVGMRKPSADIYLRVLLQENLSPQEVLFIDDREDNIEAANALGIRTFLNQRVNDWLDHPICQVPKLL